MHVFCRISTGLIEAFEARDDDCTDDEEASIDESALAIQSDEEQHIFDYIQSGSSITYTSQQHRRSQAGARGPAPPIKIPQTIKKV